MIKKVVATLMVITQLLVIFTYSPIAEASETSGTKSYYVDSVNGKDTNDGLSESSPWQSLDKINATILMPGDRLYLKSGSIWNGQLSPKGSGSSDKLIIVDKYGTGNKPLINGQGLVPATLYLYNQEYIEIKNLELTNTASDAAVRHGVLVVAEDIAICRHVYLNGLVVRDVKGDNTDKQNGGIGYVIKGSTTPTKFDDILVTNCTVSNVDRTGIYTASVWANRNGIKGSVGDWFPMTKVVIKNNTLKNIGGDGICVRVSKSPLIEYNVASDCNKRANIQNIAMWPFNCDDAIIQYNEAYLTRTILDGKGFDSDWNSNGTVIQYNYSHDNEGGFVLICSNGNDTPGAFNDGTIVRYNISEDDKNRTIELTGNSTNTQIYNNVFYLDDMLVFGVVAFQVFENAGMVPKNTYLYNNIFYNEGLKKGFDYGVAQNVVFDNNCFYSPFGEYSPSQPKDSHKIIADPQFVSPGKGKVGRNTVDGYKLKATSPLINWGKVIPNNGGKDYWGNSLNKGITDIGAFEFGGRILPKVLYKGKPISCNYAPYISKNVLFASTLDISKLLRLKVSIDKKKKVVTFSKSKKKVSLKSGSSYLKYSTNPFVSVKYIAQKFGYKYSFDSKINAGGIK